MYILFKDDKPIGKVTYGDVKKLMTHVRFFTVQGSKLIFYSKNFISCVEIEDLIKSAEIKPETYKTTIEEAKQLFPEALH